MTVHPRSALADLFCWTHLWSVRCRSSPIWTLLCRNLRRRAD